MTPPERKPFQSVELMAPKNFTDSDIERLALRQGAQKTLSAADLSTTPEGEIASPVVVSSQTPEPAVAAESAADKTKKPRATARAKMRPIKLELPDYVAKELKIRAINQGVSVRNVMMKALRAVNITIHDADMVEDGRRTNNKKPK